MTQQTISVDPTKLMESYKKNMETIRLASEAAAETLQAITKLQSQYLQETLQEVGGLLQEMITSKKPQNLPDLTQEVIQNSIKRTMHHNSVMTETISKGSSKVFKAFGSRLSSGLQEAEAIFKADKTKK